MQRLSLSIALAVALLGLVLDVRAQAPSLSETRSGSYLLDFAVPDSPAFALLDPDGSNVLRPTTVKELGLAVSEFAGEHGDFSLPKSLAAEFAPFLLWRGKNLTRADYKDAAPLYRLRVSLASRRLDGASNPSVVSIGIRTAFIDNSDLRTNSQGDAFRVKLTDAATQRLNARSLIQTLVADSLKWNAIESDSATDILTDPNKPAVEKVVELVGLGASQSQAEELVRGSSQIAQSVLSETATVIEREKQRLVDELWNASSLEMAFAVLATSADSTGRGMTATRIAWWVTAGLKAGVSSQALFNWEFGAERDGSGDEFDLRGSGASRIYTGSNDLKFFVEAQLEVADQRRPTWLFNSGGEIKSPFGGWIEFTAGLEEDPVTKDYDLVTGFKLNAGLVDPFKDRTL